MKRDSKGRFKTNTDGGLVLTIPKLSTIIYWIALAVIFLPWIIILSRLNLFEKISLLFDAVFKEAEVVETKKNGIFY